MVLSHQTGVRIPVALPRRMRYRGGALTGSLLIAALFASLAASQDKPATIKLGPPLEIGRAELLFGSIVSVCEDDKGDFYVLDQREQKVLKFSPDGRRLGAFGRRGQGPGDFQSPGRIAFTPAGELAVFEDIALVSFHKTDGAFIRRLDLSGRLGLGYVGPDRFYGWEWGPEAQRQVLVDARNDVVSAFHSIPRDRFSALLPDESGRMVMFNYSHEAYVPRFLYDYSAGLSAVGVSDRYEIALLDETGSARATLRRDLERLKINARERDFLERGLADFVKSKNWPDRVARELAKKIPAAKAIVRAVLVSPTRIFVFRFPPDITAEPPLFPVDVFTREGAFLGTAELPEVPLCISRGAMYFGREDAEGNVYLARQGYSLKP
jgi:hypothetical protein